jgi:hypothetical protein
MSRAFVRKCEREAPIVGRLSNQPGGRAAYAAVTQIRVSFPWLLELRCGQALRLAVEDEADATAGVLDYAEPSARLCSVPEV